MTHVVKGGLEMSAIESGRLAISLLTQQSRIDVLLLCHVDHLERSLDLGYMSPDTFHGTSS
jgi:hypothetical protein